MVANPLINGVGSPHDRARGKRSLAIGTAIILVSAAFYLSWWMRPDRLFNPILGLALIGTATYVIVQVLGGCFVYLHMCAPDPVRPPDGLLVDVFVPVFDEDLEIVAGCIEAVVRMRYPHTTYLLDDRRDPALRALAENLGVEYRTRVGNVDAKAGNVNAALATSHGELVTIFDVDHSPQDDFLDKVLGHFADPAVGFVQSGIGFSNTGESWYSRAAVDQCADAYGPTSMGMHGCDAAQVWGSHCTFRRAALQSIGGHAAGLAEDLHTSLLLHAAGWRSVFVPEVTAYGLAPADGDAVVKQQFKWARGVFDVLFRVFRRKCRDLSFKQNVAYALRCTYYLIGPLFFGHMVAALLALPAAEVSAREGFNDYLIRSLPFAAAYLFVRRSAWLPMPNHGPLTLHWRGYVHTLILWPVYTAALVSRAFFVPVPHIATPKRRVGHAHPAVVVPQLMMSLLLLTAVAYRLVAGWSGVDLVPMAFALTCVVIQGVAVAHASGR